MEEVIGSNPIFSTKSPDSSAGPDVSGRFHGMEEVIGSPDNYRDDILHNNARINRALFVFN
jgi:hypothetical protein